MITRQFVYVTVVQVDTLVMQNLGYFQLKASPGLWQLSIAPGGHLLCSLLWPFIFASMPPHALLAMSFPQHGPSVACWELLVSPQHATHVWNMYNHLVNNMPCLLV
jgi:hypothetical protein